MTEKEKKKALDKAWYIANAEKVKANVRAQRIANPDSRRNWRRKSLKEQEKQKSWRESNKDHLRQVKREWAANNPERQIATNAKRNARKLCATPPWLTEEHFYSIRLYYKVAKWVESILNEPIEVDHILPLQGKDVSGLHVPWNLQLLTEQQNISKGNRL